MTIAEEYQREYRRVLNLYRRIQKRGFDISLSKPTKVKKPTRKSVERLKRITSDKIYENSSYKLSTGEIIPGKVRRGQERRSAAKKAALTRLIKSETKKISESYIPNPKLSQTTEEESILVWIASQLEAWSPSPGWSLRLQELKAGDRDRLENILQGAINRYGKKVVAQRLKENSIRVKEIVESALYGSGDKGGKGFVSGRNKVDFDLVQFSEILKGEPLTSDEVMGLTALMEEQDFY